MADLSLLFWAVVPPLLLLIFYYYRLSTAPPLPRVLLFFVFGAISGLLAFGFSWMFETVASGILPWQQIQRSLPGNAVRQIIQVAPIEEGCKLAAVVLPIRFIAIQCRSCTSSIFLFTLAVSLGFTAEENCVYLFYDTASVLDRLIGTPVHAMFSAPWGYALGISICFKITSHRYTRNIAQAWLIGVIFHALVNVLASAGGYSPPLNLLSYGLFPLMLWLFWRLEQFLRRVQGKYPIGLISGYTQEERYWQMGLIVFTLFLGGNAILGLFLLAKALSSLTLEAIFSRLLLNFLCAGLAWGIYRYLQKAARS
ncbi:MAG: PrsW family glutamic-type intramembrane protease [Nostocaceae cyanobacterium]|nr:PrsW family glutamic-type intramembrane protease [Nostocaceae cyanobacterium]